ncbi:MAG: ferredoxin, partial [Crocosphaera sp.]
AFVKNIRRLKYLLPVNKYREQLQIAEQIITPLKYTIEAELKQIESGNSKKSVNLLSHCPSLNSQKTNSDDPNPTLKTNQQAPTAQAENQVNLLNNFNDWG